MSTAAAFAADPAPAAGGSSYEAEKAKALANPYPNDFGPSTIPADVLATYPAEAQAAYKNVLQVKCAKCHTPSRPLNSQYLEPMGNKEEKAAKLASWKTSNPELFSDKTIWQPEADIWQRYVKRMMSKPGCGITDAEGKAVYNFLRVDSNNRKTGKNQAAWKAHRKGLVDQFKAKYPARYKELFEQ
jgi:mono/diheme cytochrome c family protein